MPYSNKAKALAQCQKWRKANREKVNESGRRYRKNNAEKIAAKATQRHREHKYGVGSHQHFERQVEEQRNCCGMCGEKFVRPPRLDHNHETGQWRGAVCGRCNIALGYYEDRELEELAALYLEYWEGK